MWFIRYYYSKLILINNYSQPVTSLLSVGDNCQTCVRVLEGLERIDQETDNLDIVFVKVNDHRYAKKYGVNRLPALVYFRRKFPSIYRGE